MKTVIKTALLALTICLPFLASAHDIEVDGIYYNLNNNVATVTYQGSSSSSFNEYSGEVVIPATISYDGVTYPVTAIGEEAFEYSNLASVEIPNSVITIADRAFLYCESLTSVNMGNSVNTIGTWAFNSCRNLTSLNFPSSVVSIGESAFRNCSGLTSVTMGNRVQTIGNDAFVGCTGLNRVSITNMAAWCSINFATDKSNPLYYAHRLYLNGAEVQNVTIPSTITSIGNYAFDECTSLKSVTIPNSITSIGGVAFYACENLKNVAIPNSVTEIGYSAFQDCSALASVVIPNSVTAIGTNAFENCSSMTSVILSNAMTTIEEKTFAGCSSLESVTIPNGVTTIGYDAFLNCYGLASVTIPVSVTSLAYYAFENCYHISTLSLSGEGQWQGGTILIQRAVNLYINGQITGVKGMYVKPSHVYCSATTPPECDNNSFSDYSGTLHVPASSLDAYKTANYWKNFSNIIGDATQLGDVTMDGMINVNDVTTLISMILNSETSSTINSYADMNGDGTLNVTDVTLLINFILNRP